ncbi:hypothetical protein MCEMAEM4_00163 [Burkholderiaceae bacterium]
MRIVKFLALLSSLVLVACGGGGGGGSNGPVTSTETFQVKAAYVNYLNKTGSFPFTLSGTSSGVNVTGSGTLTLSTPTNSSFESAPVLQKNTATTFTIIANGVSANDGSASSSYVDSNYQPKGSSGTDYAVVTSNIAIPVTGRVGDSGTWSTENRYANSTKTSLLGTTTTSYVLEADTATTALLKIISEEKNNLGTTTFTSIETYRITASGALTVVSATASASPTFLTFTFN